MRLSIVIPCYNEIRTLPAILTKIDSVTPTLGIETEIIIVDDIMI